MQWQYSYRSKRMIELFTSAISGVMAVNRKGVDVSAKVCFIICLRIRLYADFELSNRQFGGNFRIGRI